MPSHNPRISTLVDIYYLKTLVTGLWALAHQLAGTAKCAVYDAGHECTVEAPHGGQPRQLGIGEALGNHHGSHGQPGSQIRLQRGFWWSQIPGMEPWIALPGLVTWHI